jgi:DNA-binding NtrC family response regulator
VKALLVVDDDQGCRKLYESEFADEGYAVTTASGGREALEILERATFDLVILDVKMPGMDGLETLCEIMKTKRNLPVVINSAYATFKTDFTTWSAEAYVLKSPNLDELKRTVKSVLEQKAGSC